MNAIELDIQEKHLNIMKERQIQLSELKTYFNKKNQKRYKEIVTLDMNTFNEIYSKAEMKHKIESLLSLIVSIGKSLEMSCSVKAILLSTKILEEHKKSLNVKLVSRGFVYKLFEFNRTCNFEKDDILKSTNHLSPKKEFYDMIFQKNNNLNLKDFSTYLNFQTD